MSEIALFEQKEIRRIWQDDRHLAAMSADVLLRIRFYNCCCFAIQ